MADDNDFVQLETALIEAGRSIEYPAMPDIAARVQRQLHAAQRGDRSLRLRRLRFRLRPVLIVTAVIVIALAALIAIPETREAIAQWLGLRTIHIIELTPTPTSAHATPVPTPTPGVVPFRQCCPSTLETAQRLAHFHILLPTNETPSQVFFQDQIFGKGSDAQQVILVFGDPSKPRFVLYQARSWLYQKTIQGFGKGVGGGTGISETIVSGQRALWLSGAPHMLVTLDEHGNPIWETERPVNANTLAWETGNIDNGMTYRLETTLSEDEAVQFAESLK